MPVSHLGLTVSHIPQATSFYLAALQPLGYRFLGSRGDSIGLGVHEADFFLTQEPQGYRSAPAHIAFTAADRSVVRQCYIAALNAGAYPSGSPSYREDDCNCFNAAVEDLDGNTIEFIWRDSTLPDATPDYDRTRSMTSYTRPAPARSQTARIHEPDYPSRPRSSGLQRSRTEPIDSRSSKALFGVVLGAAAGAAMGYAMIRSEKDDGRSDDRYNSYSRGRSERDREHDSRRSTSLASGGKSYREIGRSRKSEYHPPNIIRTIEARPYRDDNGIVDETISYARQTVTRQSREQSRAVEAIEYGPSRSSTRRSMTMPLEKSFDDNESRYSRRGSVPDVKSQQRRDSVVSDGTWKSQRPQESRTRSPARSSLSRTQREPSKSQPKARFSTSQASTVRPIKRDSTYYAPSAAQVPLPPSIVSKAGSRQPTPRSSRFDAYYLPDDGEDSDGLGDTATIVPDDSISCINISSKPRKAKRSSSRAEPTGSVTTIPIRSAREQTVRMRTAYSNA